MHVLNSLTDVLGGKLRRGKSVRKRSLFIGGGFPKSQLLLAIPLAHGVSQEYEVDRWVLEAPIAEEILAVPAIVDILAHYELVVSEAGRGRRIVRMVSFLALFASRMSLIFLLSLTGQRGWLLDRKNWVITQLRHATWDNALQSSPDGVIKVGFGRRLKSALEVVKAYHKAKVLSKNEAVSVAVLGHTVYASRGLLAGFRESAVKVIAHGSHVFYALPADEDLAWSVPSNRELEPLLDLASLADGEAYWNQRLRGLGGYNDARVAARGGTGIGEATPRNLLMLHVFRDSPFNQLDPTRLYDDYVTWALDTFKILSESNESWLVKPHPSANRWGENQKVWLESISREVFGTRGRPRHIRIQEEDWSNLELLRVASRVVTFAGTVHLESAGFGVRPITISRTTLSTFSPSSVLKPRSRAEYRDWLLMPSTSPELKLSGAEISLSRRLLYLREEVLDFGSDVGALPIYRGDSSAAEAAYFDSLLSRVDVSIAELQKQGRALVRGLPRTIGFRHYVNWVKHYSKSSRLDTIL